MRTPTNANGEQAIDLQVRRAERQADRAFQAAVEAGDMVTALRNGHGHMVELFGGLSRDVETLRLAHEQQHNETTGEIAKIKNSISTLDQDMRASMARLELKLGTRTAVSIGEEAMARYIGADATAKEAAAKTAMVDAEIRKFASEQRWASTQRIATALTPLLLALVGVLVAQINGCSVFPP